MAPLTVITLFKDIRTPASTSTSTATVHGDTEEEAAAFFLVDENRHVLEYGRNSTTL